MMPGDMQFFQVVIHRYKPVRAYLGIPCATGRFSFYRLRPIARKIRAQPCTFLTLLHSYARVPAADAPKAPETAAGSPPWRGTLLYWARARARPASFQSAARLLHCGIQRGKKAVVQPQRLRQGHAIFRMGHDCRDVRQPAGVKHKLRKLRHSERMAPHKSEAAFLRSPLHVRRRPPQACRFQKRPKNRRPEI